MQKFNYCKDKKSIIGNKSNKEDVTFINAFQRPCSSKYEDIDKKNREVVLKVIKIIQPSFVCFVSKKAFYLLGENLQKDIQVKIDCCPYPASPWWHRKSKRGKGKEIFKEFAKKKN